MEDDKKRYGRPRTLHENLELEKAVKDFYFINFWKGNALEKVAFLSPSIAVEVFDTAVNGGGTVLLQKTLNIMNRMGTLWPDIEVDGSIGPITLDTLATALKKRGERRIYRVLNAYQGKRYIELAEDSPKFEEFLVGWSERLSFDLPVLDSDKGLRNIAESAQIG